MPDGSSIPFKHPSLYYIYTFEHTPLDN